MRDYFRPIAMLDAARPADAVPLAGGWAWFSQVEHLRRDGSRGLIPAAQVPREVLTRLCAPRSDLAGLCFDAPRLMGILNVTPDSFSDGGLFHGPGDAVAQGRRLVDEGADLLDIGGESTRPGAQVVSVDDEISRVVPVIKALTDAVGVPISVDTRKGPVARAALDAGAGMLNDVSALGYDPDMAGVAATSNVPICLMHAQGAPENMQDNPNYNNVLFDVFDVLSDRIDAAVAAGISRENIIADPGIGFGKTLDHNLELLRGLSLFHGLGVPILLGASRKRFIGTLGHAPDAAARAPGSAAVAMLGFAQGVQISRVHDMSHTKQALRLWRAVTGSGPQS